MRRVTLFIDSLASGGAQRQVVEAARALHGDASYAWQPSIAWYNDKDRFVSLPDGVEAAPIARSGRSDVAFAGRLRSRFGTDRADVIHAFLSAPSLYAAIARHAGGAPAIVGVRCSADAFVDHRADALTYLAAAHLADHVTVNATDVVDWLAERDIPTERISYVPNMLAAAVADRIPSTKDERDACLRGYGIDPETPPITLVGRYDEYKNQDGLLRAIAGLVAAGFAVPPVLFVGRATSEQRSTKLRELTAAPGMPQVVFAEPTPKILTVMESSRLVALVSHSEGTPNVVLEALGLGRLVVATPVGQVPELIQHGATGWLAADTSDESIAAVLSDALSVSTERAETTSNAARADVLQRFGRDAVSKRLVELYGEVAKRPRRPRTTAAIKALMQVSQEVRAGGSINRF